MFTICSIALTNMMACRVFRHTKFGNFREETISTQWLASHNPEAGKESVVSSLCFVSFRSAETETDDLDVDSCDRVVDRVVDIEMGGRVEKKIDHTIIIMEKEETRTSDCFKIHIF